MFNSGNLGNLGQNLNLSNQPLQQINKGEAEKMEITAIIKNYKDIMDASSPDNKLKHMLYNRLPQMLDKNQASYFLQYQPQMQNFEGKFNYIDYNMWNEAIQKIPINDNTIYPHQVSSPFQLSERIKTASMLELKSIEDIQSLKERLNVLNNNFEGNMKNNTQKIREKLNIIKKKQVSVISKLEKLVIYKGRGDYNHYLENVINTKLNYANSTLQNNFHNKVNELKSKAQTFMVDSSRVDDDFLKNSNQERLSKSVNLLKDMKKIFDITYINLNQNKTCLEFMQDDFEYYNLYGKIK